MTAGRVKQTNVGFNLMQAMIAKKVDATLGAFWNYEGVDLQRRGRKPHILRMESLGVPTYDELIFAARHQDLDEEGALEAAPLPRRPPRAATSCSQPTPTWRRRPAEGRPRP